VTAGVRPLAVSQTSEHRPANGDAPLRAPVNTYRIQLHHAFTLRHLDGVCTYLHQLGVTDCYTSPVLTARAGSTHGYDICDHNELNPELGTIDDLRALAKMLEAHDMGLVLDFVPNHMGIDPAKNLWWRDVLENGPSSPYARYFDIDWTPIKPELHNKVLLPILGDQYGVVLEHGELRIAYDEGALTLNYFDRNLPLNPRHQPMVLGHGIESLTACLGEHDGDLREFREILSALSNLPPTSERDEANVAARQRDKESARRRLGALTARSARVADHIAAAIALFNGSPGERASFDLLHALLEVQAYRLAYWRTAFDEINYRRFFDVNDLAGLRMEDARVFAATHALLLQLVEQRIVTGLRIDHPDGLFDPAAYFDALQHAASERLATSRRVYVLAEKILGRGERLRDDWQVHGTTGYGFLNTLNGLFVHREGLNDLRRFYRRYTGQTQPPADTVYDSKKFMMRTAMASELNVLSRALNRESETDRRSRDFTLNSLRRALVEVIACFPVYRTYITDRGANADDLGVLENAIGEAQRRNPIQEPSIFEFVRHALVPQRHAQTAQQEAGRGRSVAFAQKFQQYTAPVVAKGLEDTAFYRDVLLLSANEVGGDLRYRVRSVTEFHAENLYRLSRWPYEMTAGSTHDTKRGEDARARIRVIAELAADWRGLVRRWSAINEPARRIVQGAPAPDRLDEWMFYQALIGAWPSEAIEEPICACAPVALVDRMAAYMVKAVKEAKRRTSWLHENVEYEDAVRGFVHAVLAGEHASGFLSSFVPFQRRVGWFGMFGSLSELVLRLAAPGVPDTYQGAELWNLALVDPDNRRPVDFDRRRHMLNQLEPMIEAAEEARVTTGRAPDRSAFDALLASWTDGRVKMYTLAMALRLRRAFPELFLRGDYEPLGSDLDDPHLVAFSRRNAQHEVVVLVPRFLATFLRGTPQAPLGMDRWRTASVRLPSRLADAKLINVFTGERVEPVVYRDVPWLLAGSAFQTWPVALLWVS
jgi:(1->4)-alpha-D-glucan 1-alpha-D-glucosylmutase